MENPLIYETFLRPSFAPPSWVFGPVWAFLYVLQNYLLASIDILIILGSLIWAIKTIFPHYRWVAYAQIPYLAWVSFATVLEISITVLNP